VRLTQLHLRNFRNYRSLDWRPGPGLTILAGGNAQGKSNLLEAIAVLVLARSPRASADRETIAWSALAEPDPVARLVALVERRRGPVELEVALRALPEVAGRFDQIATAQKRVRVNGVPCRASELVGQLNAAFFSPDDVQLVTGPPALRRRYLDMAISQVDRRYLRELQRYQRVLLQRNHLLRRVGEGAAPAAELEYWDQELAQSGAAIVLRRRWAVGLLGPQASLLHRRLTGDVETLHLSYHEAWEQPQGALGADAEEKAVASALRAALAALLPREIRAGASLLGPHRDDMVFLLDGRPLAAFGSRGQQRTAVLALKLAEATFLEKATEERPLVLLDDVLSELDAARREQVLELAASLEQAFITVSEPDSVPHRFLAQATVVEVQSGALKPLAR